MNLLMSIILAAFLYSSIAMAHPIDSHSDEAIGSLVGPGQGGVVCGHCFVFEAQSEKKSPEYTVCGDSRREINGLKRKIQRDIRESDEMEGELSDTFRVSCE